jgi:hypothetical protein
MYGVFNTNVGVKLFEDLVDHMVAAPAVPPSLNNSFVITMDCEVLASCANVSETKHSKPIASAQPMSRWPCNVCHPGMSLQALHLLAMMMAMPIPELASSMRQGQEVKPGWETIEQRCEGVCRIASQHC